VLLGPPRGQHIGVAGGGEQRGGGPLVGRGDPGHPLDPLRPPRRRGPPHGVEPGGAGGEVVVAQVAVGDHGVQDAQRQREIRARRGLQVQCGQLGGGRAARVDDDELGAAEVLHERRHGLGRVAADQQHRVRVPQVLDRERQPAVHAERPRPGGRGRGHAEPSVVVDLRGAEGDAGELAEQVGLLVGEPAATEHRDGVPPVPRLQVDDPVRDQVQRAVPRGRPQLAVHPDQWCGQAGR
jgi:hypothetical protein